MLLTILEYFRTSPAQMKRVVIRPEQSVSYGRDNFKSSYCHYVEIKITPST